jgi:hypothetical protein
MRRDDDSKALLQALVGGIAVKALVSGARRLGLTPDTGRLTATP